MPTIRVETVKGDIYEVKHVFSLTQVKEQLAKVYKTQSPALRFFYNGHEVTDANVNMEAMEEKGNVFVIKSRSHDVDSLLVALKLRVRKMCEVFRTVSSNFVRFQKRVVCRGQREEDALHQLEEQIRSKTQLKLAYASRRQYLEADEMKRAIEVLQDKLKALQDKLQREQSTGLVDAKSREIESFGDLKNDVMKKLEQTEIVVKGYFDKLQTTDRAAIERLNSRIEVLELDNAAKIQNAMKNLAREIMEAEQEMDALAAQEEYRAANDAKLRIAYLQKQVKIMSDYNFKDALAIYAKVYSSKKAAAEAPAGVNLNVHGEFEIYLTYRTVLKLLGERVSKHERESKLILGTLSTLATLIESLPMPDLEADSKFNANAQLILKRILNASILLSAKAASTRSALVGDSGASNLLRLKNRSENGTKTPSSVGARTWDSDEFEKRTSRSPIRESVRRALNELALSDGSTPRPMKASARRGGRKLSDSVASLEREVGALTGEAHASPMV